MTIWHAMHHLAGWPSRTKARLFELDDLKTWAENNYRSSQFVSGSPDVQKVYLSNHDWWAKRFNARKFWWMRKIKLMSE